MSSVPILVSPEITEALWAVVAVGCLYFLYAEEQASLMKLCGGGEETHACSRIFSEPS